MGKERRYCCTTGCPHEPQKGDEYCVACQCGSFSVMFGQCVLGKEHRNKHLSKDGGEWP